MSEIEVKAQTMTQINWDDAENPLVKLFVGYDVEGYVEEYELEGEEGYYTPNEQEKTLLVDAIYGVVSDIHEKLRALLPSDFDARIRSALVEGKADPVQPEYGYMRIVEVFDRNETAGAFLSEDGEGGFAAGVSRMADEIDRLRRLPYTQQGEGREEVKARPYRCPGCDREANVYVKRTTLHSFGNNGLVYSISCNRDDDVRSLASGHMPNSCLGEWFAIRPFQTETTAISTWNDAIIEMAAAALGITRKQALAIKEGRAATDGETKP